MYTVINDTHLGAKRSAGTTPASQRALQDWQFEQFEALIQAAESTLIINGDLFDTFDVDNAVLVRTFDLLDEWLYGHSEHQLCLVAGNHDLAKDSSKLSSFETLGLLLSRKHFSDQLQRINGQGEFVFQSKSVWAVPHMPNQDLFDLELSRIPADAKVVLLHCNFDNNFAAQSDHSLNLTYELATALPGTLVLGHEHQDRVAVDGKVWIAGNQIPTSVADCLGCEHKYLTRIDHDWDVRAVPWLPVSNVFEEVDWRDLGEHSDSAVRFVRVTGHATAAEAAEVVTAIAKARAKSSAFVMTNAVTIEGASIMAGVVESLESAKSFDVQAAILAMLDEREREVVNRLYGLA